MHVAISKMASVSIAKRLMIVLAAVFMPRAELPRHTVIVLSVCNKHFLSLTENQALKQATQAELDIYSDSDLN